MLHGASLYAEVADLGDAAVLELYDLEEVVHVVVRGALDEILDASGPAGRSQNGDLAHRLLCIREGVVQQRHVGEVIGMHVADPHGVQVLEVDVALQRTEGAASDVDQDVGAGALQEVAGARLVGLRVRGAAQRGPPDATIGSSIRARHVPLPPCDDLARRTPRIVVPATALCSAAARPDAPGPGAPRPAIGTQAAVTGGATKEADVCRSNAPDRADVCRSKAAGRADVWRADTTRFSPIRLGVVQFETGAEPSANRPIAGRASAADRARTSRFGCD